MTEELCRQCNHPKENHQDSCGPCQHPECDPNWCDHFCTGDPCTYDQEAKR